MGEEGKFFEEEMLSVWMSCVCVRERERVCVGERGEGVL